MIRRLAIVASMFVAAAAQATPRLLIVHAASLHDAASSWSTYRTATGWSVTSHEVGAGATTSSVRDAIRAWYLDAPDADASTDAVLLLGDAGAGGIPTFHFPNTDPVMIGGHDHEYATDQPYQIVHDGRAAAMVALGRVPARTVAEAEGLLARIRQAEEAPVLGEWRRRITYVAGEGGFGAYDTLLETLFIAMLDRYIDEDWDIDVTYASAASVYCPPPSDLTSTVVARYEQGGLLFNYIGHGHPRGLGSMQVGSRARRLLEARDLGAIDTVAGTPTLALLTCCSTGYYDLPDGTPSFAESLLFHPHGPISVIAGSRITHPYANAVFQKDITHALLDETIVTVGALDRAATRSLLTTDADDAFIDSIALPIALAGRWQSSLTDLRRSHARLYNLLGDPATRLSRPHPGGVRLSRSGDVVRGTTDGIDTGEVVLTVESSRRSCAAPDRLRPDLPGLEARATLNYPIIRQRRFIERRVPIVDGRFEWTPDVPLPGAAAFVKAYAIGVDRAGLATDAVGHLDLGGRAGKDPSGD
ncbi:MAG: hypothetical protein KDA25_10020 [Phycisphaerales bacterium]|nr:hypothetical protein [Phycisphaerales bacterium]